MANQTANLTETEARLDRAALIASLLEHYGKPTSGASVYELGLTEVDDDLLIDAISEILKTSKWMPRVSEILETARDIQDRRDNPPVDFVTYRNHCWRYFNQHLFDDNLWDSREYKWLKRNGYVGQPANPEFDKSVDADGQALIGWLMSGITVAA